MSSDIGHPDSDGLVGPARWTGSAQRLLRACWLRANRHKDQTFVDFSIDVPRDRMERLKRDARPLDVIEFALAAMEWEARVNMDDDDESAWIFSIIASEALPLIRLLQGDDVEAGDDAPKD